MDASNVESFTLGDGSIRARQDVALVVGQYGTGPSVVILRPVGDLDLLTAPELRSQLSAQLNKRKHVILDLCEVTFLSSQGLQVLVEAHLLARDCETVLHITGAGRRLITRPLQITGLDSVLVISDAPAATLAAQLVDRQAAGRDEAT